MNQWESFYVIVGSSGAALIGIQFVVITLISDTRAAASPETISAFGTPTVVHFAGALVVAATMTAPWPSTRLLASTLIALGSAGLVYGFIIIRRARRQSDYAPVWQDWLWHAALPCLVYAALIVAAAFMIRDPESSLFAIGSAALGLLLIGVHNSWDTVTHIVITNRQGQEEREG
jgi:hypothetical protein